MSRRAPLFAPGVISHGARPQGRWRRLAGRALRWGWHGCALLGALVLLLVALWGPAVWRQAEATAELVCQQQGGV
jgi:hypothetical protein